GTATCSAACEQILSSCVEPGGQEMELCSDVSGGCESPLLCGPLPQLGDRCYLPCDPTSLTSCDALHRCVRHGTASQGFCAPLATSGGRCYPAYATGFCADASDTCIQTGTEDGTAVGVCGTACATDAVNTGQGNCPAGAYCLPRHSLEVETSSECASSAECTTASNFLCRGARVGGQIEQICARPEGVCGPRLALQDDLFASPSPDEMCDVSGAATNGYCGLINAAYPTAIVDCRPVSDGADRGFCVAYCHDPGGVGADLDCGSDAACVDSGYVERQGGSAPVDCSQGGDGDCNTELGYTCVSISSSLVCARPIKLCTLLP
ncbi:MAG: hypothetical protein V3T05_03680, partial [Myxococcota bacterium]